MRAALRLLGAGALAASLAGATGCSTMESHGAPIESQIVMFYYDDLAAPTEFYGKTLGLAQTQDFGWARFFQVVPGSEVGLVKAGPGAYYTTQPRNAVMLSIVTPDVEAWYQRLKGKPGVDIVKDLQPHGDAPIRNFMIRDPGGYTIEIFQWLKRP
jgi:predicted enzyme related to lactoylglutathione lyase